MVEMIVVGGFVVNSEVPLPAAIAYWLELAVP